MCPWLLLLMEEAPGRLPPGWHGLTFPEDAVHAVQGMGVAARGKRGRCQGRGLPNLPPTRWLPQLPTAAGAALPPHSPPTSPGPQGPHPTHFRRRWAGCLTSFCILQGRARGAAGGRYWGGRAGTRSGLWGKAQQRSHGVSVTRDEKPAPGLRLRGPAEGQEPCLACQTHRSPPGPGQGPRGGWGRREARHTGSSPAPQLQASSKRPSPAALEAPAELT